MEIKKVMVVGCGQMGQGIAQVCARGGAETVYMCDISDELSQKGVDIISLYTFTDIIEAGNSWKYITEEEKKMLLEWHRDPIAWGRE